MEEVVIKKLLLSWVFPVLAFGQTAPTQIYAPPEANHLDEPVTPRERLNWFVYGTVGPASLFGGLISAGFGTWTDQPKEYGTHWDGFGQRYGMRLTGVSVGNAMEAGFGALWGEDPRYQRDASAPFKTRVGHVVKMTFLAYNREGGTMPAYSRFIAIPGNNFISNAWRADSEATVDKAIIRTSLGFLGRMSGNAFEEFWPDAKQRLLHRGKKLNGPPQP